MTWLRRILAGFNALVRNQRVERELDEELRVCLDLSIEEKMHRGMRREEAVRAARVEMGSLEAVKDYTRDVGWETRLENVWRDLRYAVRMLRRSPGFAAVAVLTLALGIGANAAFLSLFNQVLLRPLPVPGPDRLVNLVSPGPRSGPTSCGSIGECEAVFSYPMFRDLQRIQTVFTGIAAHRDLALNLAYRGQTTTGQGLVVSGSYFPVLGLRAALGRLLGPHDDRSVGGSEVVVLSHAYWQSHFNGSADVLDDTMLVNGQPVTIVGVAPQGFDGTTVGLKADVFLPITMRWRLAPDPRSPPDNRRGYWVYLFARLKPGVTIEQARTAIDTPYRAIINEVEVPLQQGMSGQMMGQFKARGIRLDPGSRGQSTLAADARVPLTLLLGVTALVLVIACVNVANLLLARASARSKELATRLSIGATRGRLIAQLVTESSVLGCLAAVASLLIAQWTMALIQMTLPEGASNLPLQMDAFAVGVTAALAAGTGVMLGLAPVVHAGGRDAFPALKAQAGQPSGGRASARFRASLAAVQVAVSMVLVVLAGLFTKSLGNINRVDPGLRADNVVTFSISPGRNGYALPRSVALFDRLEEEIAAQPGVTAVATSTTPLLSGQVRTTSAFVEGLDSGPDANRDSRYDEIGPGYFRTLGVPLISGREFTRADAANGTKVAIVNEEFAKKFALGHDAVGKRMSRDIGLLDLEIVGLVRDFKQSNLRDAPAPMYFVPHHQGSRRPGVMTFYVRTSPNADGVFSAIRQVVRRLDPNLPIDQLRTMDDAMRGAMTRERLMGVITGAFGILATLVAAIGLYGVLAYSVAQRTQEIGVRMALGATRARVRWMVLRQVGTITIIGGTIGLAFATLLGRAAQSLLFGLQFHDAAVLASSTAVLLLVALAAGLVPAHRAAHVDPMRALKYE